MMSVRPFLLATLPTYILFAGMILSAIGAYSLSQAMFNNPFPSPNPGVPGFVFFALFTVSFLIELGVYSRMTDRLHLGDIRVPLPRHWRSVILDMISWTEAHEQWEAGLVLGGIATVTALSEAVIFAMQAIHASVLVFLVVGFAGLFVIFFGLSVGQVLVRSAISPVGVLSDEELAELLAALPSLTRENIEYMKREKTFVPSLKARRAANILFAVAFAAFGAALGAMYWNLSFAGLPFAYLGSFASTIAIVLTGFPIFGTKVSSLSRILERKVRREDPD